MRLSAGTLSWPTAPTGTACAVADIIVPALRAAIRKSAVLSFCMRGLIGQIENFQAELVDNKAGIVITPMRDQMGAWSLLALSGLPL